MTKTIIQLPKSSVASMVAREASSDVSSRIDILMEDLFTLSVMWMGDNNGPHYERLIHYIGQQMAEKVNELHRLYNAEEAGKADKVVRLTA